MVGFFAALLTGCGPSGEVPTLRLPDPPVYDVDPVEVPPSWLRTGEEGHFSLIRSAPTYTRGQEVRVAALFGAGLDGPAYPATCALEQQLCVEEEDALDVDRFVPAEGVAAERFSWLGDRMTVGAGTVPFRVLEGEQGAAGYAGVLAAEAPLIDRLPVQYGAGEWGEGRFEVDLPELITGLEPAATASVPVDATGLQVFRWAPRGGTLYLALTGETWSSTRPIADDGSVWVDTREFRLGEPVEVKITRVTEQGEVQIGSNRVQLRGVAEQGWCLTDGCEDQPFDVYPRPFDFQFCWSASSCNTSSWRLEGDGTWSTGPFVGTWTFDCCKRRIELEFTSGTRYWATRGEDGCYRGEMLSWTGNRGTWTTCP